VSGYNGRMALVRNGLPEDILRHATRLVATAAPATEAYMETDPRTPDGKPRPGGGPKLKECFVVDRSPRTSATTVTVTARNTAPHARYTDEGTQPHPIRPRFKRALAFEADGLHYVVKQVGHPGNQGTHWWEDVAQSSWDLALAQANFLV